MVKPSLAVGLRSRRRTGERGFAYLWTLMLVVAVGLGLGVAAQMDSTMARRERERELLFIGRQFRAAIASYQSIAGTGGRPEYPARLEDLLRDDRVPGLRRHLRRIYADPMTGKAEWGLVRVAGRIVGVHSLSEQAPIKLEGFDGDDAGLRQRQRYADWVFAFPPDILERPQAAGAAASAPAIAASSAVQPAAPAASAASAAGGGTAQ